MGEYRTQSADTAIEAELVQFGIWRRMTPAQRLECVDALNAEVEALAMVGLRRRFPGATEATLRKLMIARRLGSALYVRAYREDPPPGSPT